MAGLDAKEAPVPAAPSQTEKELGPLDTSIVEDEPRPDYPSEEDFKTLRRVHGSIPLKVFTIAFVELCERFSYYGSIVVCKFFCCACGLREPIR